jgi:dihydrofolate synthase/folylpolyglutamate synthase
VKSSPATAVSSMPSAADHTKWLESLSPWPEEFGLDRMRELLRELGDPQRAFPSIHVVGTNGKTTTTRLAEALLAGEGLSVGGYTSPHVVGWAERIRVGRAEADLDVALARVRVAAQKLGATQFEALTAAALAEFAAADVDVAVVEAGLGGRHDATNVLDASVVLLTNVSLEHTDVLGGTRKAIAAEKLAVLGGEGFAVLGEPEWEEQARAAGAKGVVVTGNTNLALALAAVETFLGRPVDPAAAEDVQVPGRMERISDRPLEIWDGAHNLAGVGWLLARLPARRYVVVASILTDKDADGMLAALSVLGDQIVVATSSNPRALSAGDLGARAARFFPVVNVVEEPADAVSAAREAAGEEGAVLVTGSLYLLADLAAVRPPTPVPWRP